MSTAHLQCLLKDVAIEERLPVSIDPENLIWRIDLILAIETAYYRGLISAYQIELLDYWLEYRICNDKQSLLAALEAIATISGFTDDAFNKRQTEDILLKLEELSNELTQEIV